MRNLLKHKSFKFLFLTILSVTFLTEACSTDPKALINVRSDAEVINDYKTHQEEYNRIIQQIYQVEEDRKTLIAKRDKDNEAIDAQLKKIDEINWKDEKAKQDEKRRLQNQKTKNQDLFFQLLDKERNKVDADLKTLGNLSHAFFSSSIKIITKIYSYEDPASFFRIPNDSINYNIEKGFVLFAENSPPDPQYVVDNFDSFQVSGNAKTIADKVLDKYGKKINKGFDEVRIYMPIEGNLYIYMKVSKSLNYPPLDSLN